MNKITKKYKVILDTDIGDDIDDAFALSLLLNSEEVELLGVTTVFRNTLKRAKMAAHLIKMYNKDVLVYKGIDQPIVQDVNKLIPEEIKKKEKLDEFGKYLIPQYKEEMDNNEISDINGVDFIIDTIKKYPHEVILLAIGPLTNIAMAIRKAPEIVDLVKEIRIMGGWLEQTYPEWNIYCDPEAAHIVYTSGAKIFAVGLDCTLKCTLDKTDLEDLKNAKENACVLISEMLEKWFKHYEFKTPVMHDPLAAGTILSDFCTFEQKKMKVCLNEFRGHTKEDDSATIINVATKVNEKEFLKFFKTRVFKI